MIELIVGVFIGVFIGGLILIWAWLISKIFWKEGFKELDNVLGKKKVNLNNKKEENGKESK